MNMPRRPSTAFFFYMKEKRMKFKNKEEFQKRKTNGTMGMNVSKVVKQIGLNSKKKIRRITTKWLWRTKKDTRKK